MTLKELLSVTTIDNDKLHISTRINATIISELSYITEYMSFADCEAEDITIIKDELYIIVKEKLGGGENG